MIRTLDFRTYSKFIQCIEYKFCESTERTFFTKHDISVKKIKRLCSTFISDARVQRCIVNILDIGYILFRIQIRFLALRKRYVNSWIVLYMVREEGGEGKTVGTCATSQGGGGKKRNRAVCLLLIYRGARSLFRYYGLSTSFSTCTDCELHSSSPPANQFNDFIRPPSPSRTREIEISCFKGKCERLWKCFGCKKRKIALSNCFLRSIWKYNIFVI